MKNMLISACLIFTLTSCASSSSDSDRAIKIADNSDIISTTCDDIATNREATQRKIEILRSTNRWLNTGNALAVGAALLSFNPQSLFDIRSTSQSKKALASYEERANQLDQRSKELNCSL